MGIKTHAFVFLCAIYVVYMAPYMLSLLPQPPGCTSYKTTDFVPCDPKVHFCGLPHERINCTLGDSRARDDQSGEWHRVCIVTDLDTPTVVLPFVWERDGLVYKTYYLVTGAPYEPIAINQGTRVRMKSNVILPEGSMWHPHRKADRFLIIGEGTDRNITFIVEQEGSPSFPLVTKYVQKHEYGMWEQNGRWVFMPAYGHGTEAF